MFRDIIGSIVTRLSIAWEAVTPRQCIMITINHRERKVTVVTLDMDEALRDQVLTAVTSQFTHDGSHTSSKQQSASIN